LQGNVILWATLNALVPWDATLNALVPWDLFFAYRLGQQRATLRGLLPQWLTIWHELEALAALRTFGWLNPEYARPQITVTQKADEAYLVPTMVAASIGHPLIAHENRVCNDFRLQSNTVVLLTG